MPITSWTIPGSNDQPIYGNTHRPASDPRGVVVIAHGFKGYKDYGMFPRIAAKCANAGFIAHRFNFSHSGMTNEIETFARPDLFEMDTWNKQVNDLRNVIQAMIDETIDGSGLPYVIFGHSRGGVTALLTAGRYADDPSFPQPCGVITVAAPSSCNFLTNEQEQELLETGYLESPSSRTGQKLRIGAGALHEMQNDPGAHDLAKQVAHIRCPILIIHGDKDPTVPYQCADEIRSAAQSEAHVCIVPNADHVINTPNPMSPHEKSSSQLQALIDSVISYSERVI